MENMKIEVWNNELKKMVYYDTQQELEESQEFSDWVDEQIEKLYMDYKIDPYAVEEFLRGYFAMYLWELNGNGGNILYPNLKNPADFCWTDFKRDCCVEQDRIFIKSAHSGTSEEEIAKAIILYKMDGYTDDDIKMTFSDNNNVISVVIDDQKYVIYDGNPKEQECDCEGIWNEDGEWECECEDEYDTWEMTDEQVHEKLKDYHIIWM